MHAAATSQPLTQGRIFRFFLPLALSWIFMAIDGPISVGVISRMPQEQVMTAAFLIMMSLSIWIESPVIDLLATATTLAKNRQHYVALSRFTWWVMAIVTLMHGIVTFTPLYWVVSLRILGLPPDVAEAARLGMMIMLPWSAFIGWRRYLQGIMIRYGETRMIGIGTAIRVLALAVVALALFWTVEMPSIAVVAIGLIASVVAESLFIHWASRRVIAEHLAHDRPEDDSPPLTQRKLLTFHLPLTATTMVMLLGMPAVSAALSRAPDSVAMLAGYQVAGTLLFLLRTVTFALPEVVIALHKDGQTAAALRRFCVGVGASNTLLLLALAVTGLDVAFFRGVLRANPETAQLAHYAFLGGALLPLIGAVQGYVRGMLTAYHLTVARFQAVLVSMSVLVGTLAILVATGWIGLITAALSLSLSMTAELAVLTWFWRRGKQKLGLDEEGAPA
jgi:progressive ankylosis protein